MPPPKRCTTLETHAWSPGTTTVLALPDARGWMDVFRVWRCTRCGLHTWATGAVDVTTPPLSPVQWEAQASRLQASGDLYGQALRRQEAHERERRALARRLREGR